MKIETCLHNLQHGSQQVFLWAQATNPNLQLGVWDCLEFCEACARGPFLWINNHKLIQAPTSIELWQTLQVHLQDPDF
ncbi:DUF1450 domain-containing protein [Alicyclobacillaceae bacterium I2511]|nr:DUF1450 domain-containing protein [Alicyclobacillaceae bacterium I2511]